MPVLIHPLGAKGADTMATLLLLFFLQSFPLSLTLVRCWVVGGWVSAALQTFPCVVKHWNAFTASAQLCPQLTDSVTAQVPYPTSKPEWSPAQVLLEDLKTGPVKTPKRSKCLWVPPCVFPTEQRRKCLELQQLVSSTLWWYVTEVPHKLITPQC